MRRKALVYFTQFNAALGGSEYLPLTFAAELQKTCDVTLALNWESDVARAAETMRIPVDMSRLQIVYVKPKSRLLQRLDAILPFYRTWRLKHLAKDADICISTVNMFDFGKPAHHFVFMLRHFGDNAFIDYINHVQPKTGIALFRRKLRTLIAEHILRPLLGVRSTRTILADPRERIYPNSLYVERVMRDFYGSFSSTLFYPPTICEFRNGGVVRNPFKVVYIGQIFPEKRVADIIGIVERAREISGCNLLLDIAGPLSTTPYVEKIKDLASHREWVSLLGGVYGKDKEIFLLSATYAIHAERDEAFGISVTEYLKAGLVPIVPDEGGATEIVGSDSLTYHLNEAAAQILSKLLHDEAFRKEQQRLCSERAKHFSLQSYMERQRILLKRIVAP